MEPALTEFAAVAAQVRYSPPRVVLISNLSGRRVDDSAIVTPAYWVRQARETVRFADGAAALSKEGCRIFLEIGPRPTLLGLARQVVPQTEHVFVPSLRQDGNDWEHMLAGLAGMYAAGIDVDWAGFDRDYARRRVEVPSYPFQRQRLWAQPVRSQPAADAARARRHPLLERRLALPLRDLVFETRLRSDAPAYLADHRIQGAAVLPAAAYLELALAGASETSGSGRIDFGEIAFHEPLVLPEGEEQSIHLVLSPPSEDQRVFQVFRKTAEGWRLHAGGNFRDGVLQDTPAQPLETLRRRCTVELPVDAYYDGLRVRGLEYGPSFRGIRWIAKGDGEALGEVVLPEELAPEAHAYRLHPAFLDACLQVLGAALPEDEDSRDTYLLAGIERFSVYAIPENRVWSHASARRDASGIAGDIRLIDDAGNVIAEVIGLQARRAAASALRRPEQDP
jgi:myxalamid-type polyketide synthase MxaB